MANTAAVVVPIVVIVVLLVWFIVKGFYTVREKEVIIIERLGAFNRILTAGIHWVWPCIERPKSYSVRYTVVKNAGTYSERVETVEHESYRISVQNEVLDFPKQSVITRDNARVDLDAVLSYQLVSGMSARTMVYSVANLPYVIGQLLKAQLRNVAATLDVDQIIEDSAAMDVLTQLLNEFTMRWGVHINFVKIQRVEPASDLAAVLAKKKNADLTNKNVIINAQSAKQTALLGAEGERDGMIKTAEGEAQKKIAKAQGEAAAKLNAATAEAEALRKVVPVIQASGGDPISYFLNQKYLAALSSGLAGANVEMVPEKVAHLRVAKELGLNAIPAYAVPPAAGLPTVSTVTKMLKGQ